jgi:16S rRNA (guanine527-N7)-methyltransferase
VTLEIDVAERLAAYVELLQKWNKRINLTALADNEAGLDRLIIEPVGAARHLPKTGSVIDIGSGGGSPALPLKIISPKLRLRMVESKTRKGAFLREAIRQLELDAAEVDVCRYEELLSRPELHETHDALTVRAVRMERNALRNLQAFVRPGGLLALLRGGNLTHALDDVQPPLVWEATFPLVESLRSQLVVVRKLALMNAKK